jgi:glycerol-3-phosphate dehydrogenase (NAD(P)+)
MGTAMAMHLARAGHRTVLWASEFDQPILPGLLQDRRHPALPEHLPESLRVMGPNELDVAGAGVDLAVMGAHSGGARTLARVVCDGRRPPGFVVGVAKGLEDRTLKRMSEVYAEEVGHGRVVSMGGPCLAAEIAQGLPTGAVLAALDRTAADESAALFRTREFHVSVTDDLLGLEYCTVAKNVAAIGLGILDGMGKGSGLEYRNAKSALFAQAFAELEAFVVSMGGRPETARGLAGLGDTLVTSLGGRNRLFGELLGEGFGPEAALDDLLHRGMTVEGVDASRDIRVLCERAGLDLPFFDRIHAIVFGGARAPSIVDCLNER